MAMTEVKLKIEIPDHLRGYELLLGTPDFAKGDWGWNGRKREFQETQEVVYNYQTLILRPVLKRYCPYCGAVASPPHPLRR
jgi:hypothetical protein